MMSAPVRNPVCCHGAGVAPTVMAPGNASSTGSGDYCRFHSAHTAAARLYYGLRLAVRGGPAALAQNSPPRWAGCYRRPGEHTRYSKAQMTMSTCPRTSQSTRKRILSIQRPCVPLEISPAPGATAGGPAAGSELLPDRQARDLRAVGSSAQSHGRASIGLGNIFARQSLAP